MPFELPGRPALPARRARKQAFISLISLISTLGVAVGVMALVIALALMTGLQGELRDRILGSKPHIYVCEEPTAASPTTARSVARLRQLPHVVGAAPGDSRQGARPRRRARRRFITLKGIDPALERP